MVVNKSHHGASNANSEKINSVTPIFLNFIQFYMKMREIIESSKKFSGADFMLLLKTVIFEWLQIRSGEFFKFYQYFSLSLQ